MYIFFFDLSWKSHPVMVPKIFTPSVRKNFNFSIFKINVVPKNRDVQYLKKYKPQVPKLFAKKSKNIPRRNWFYTIRLFSLMSELCRTKNFPHPGWHKGTRTTLPVLTVPYLSIGRYRTHLPYLPIDTYVLYLPIDLYLWYRLTIS